MTSALAIIRGHPRREADLAALLDPVSGASCVEGITFRVKYGP